MQTNPCHKDITAVQRLKLFALEKFGNIAVNLNYENSNNGFLEEQSINCILKNQQDFHMQVSLISEIIEYGNKTGEFSEDDILVKAESICLALTIFDSPIYDALYKRAEISIEIDHVIDLIILGIRKN